MDNDLDLFQTPQNPQRAATLREMARRSQDRIRVYNPLNEDFKVKWDGYSFVIPAYNKDAGHGNGQMILPRYVAENYCKHMTDLYLGKKLVEVLMKENTERREKGLMPMTEQEEARLVGPYRTDNKEARAKLIAETLWLGIEEEYGIDDIKEEDEQKTDPRSIDDVIFASLDKPARKRVDGPVAPPPPPPVQPLDTSKDEFIAELT